MSKNLEVPSQLLTKSIQNHKNKKVKGMNRLKFSVLFKKENKNLQDKVLMKLNFRAATIAMEFDFNN